MCFLLLEFEIEIECLAITANSISFARLFHSVAVGISASCQKYESPGRGYEGASSKSLTRTAMLVILSDLTTESNLAKECEFASLYVMA